MGVEMTAQTDMDTKADMDADMDADLDADMDADMDTDIDADMNKNRVCDNAHGPIFWSENHIPPSPYHFLVSANVTSYF